MFEVERRQQERCDCRSRRAAPALRAGCSSSRLCVPPAAPEPCHCSDLGPAKPVSSSHAAMCWLSCLLTLLGRGNKEWGLSSSTGRLVKCAGWGCAWCGAGTLAALTGVFLTRVATRCSGPFHLCCLYSPLKVLFLKNQISDLIDYFKLSPQSAISIK